MDAMASRGHSNVILRALAATAVLLLISGLAVLLLLRQGVTIDQLQLGPMAVSELQIIWAKKLKVRVQSLVVDTGPDKERTVFEPSEVRKRFQQAARYLPLFSLLEIEGLTAQGRSLSLSLNESAPGRYSLNVQGDLANLAASITYDSRQIAIAIRQAEAPSVAIRTMGTILVDLENLSVTGRLRCDFGAAMPVALHFVADRNEISFSGAEAGEIHDIRPLVNLFQLEQSTSKWFTDYLAGSRYQLRSFSGTFAWQRPEQLLDTLHAEVRVDTTAYIFNPALAPITASHTDATFANRLLDIHPHQARFHHHQADETSRVTIDFSDLDNILLSARINAVTAADDTIANLLAAYDIPFPIRQTAGQTDAALTLNINLNSEEVGVTADFAIADGIIRHEGRDHQIENALASLNNSRLTITKATYLHGNMVTARFTADIDLAEQQGAITILPNHLTIPTGQLSPRLDPAGPAPEIRLALHGPTVEITTTGSTWLVGERRVSLAPVSAAIDLHRRTISVAPTAIQSAEIKALVSGSFDLDRPRCDLEVELHRLDLDALVLASTPYSLSVRFDGDLQVVSGKEALLRYHGIPLRLTPLQISSTGKEVRFMTTELTFGNYWQSPILASYDMISKTGTIHTSGMAAGHSASPPPRQGGPGKTFSINLPEIDGTIDGTSEGGLSIHLENLANLVPYSPLLFELGISAGSLTVTSPEPGGPFRLQGDLALMQPVLFDGMEPVTNLELSGWLDQGTLSATVNTMLLATITGARVDLTSRGQGYNLPGIIDLLHRIKHTLPPGDEPGGLAVTLSATDTFVQLKPKSRLLADRIDLAYSNNELITTLEHGAGRILLQQNGKTFSLGGQNLDAAFMGELLHQSTFSGGTMFFSAEGEPRDFKAVVEIKDALLKDSAVVNNLVSLLNTIPALITFSLPDYNIRGLRIDSAAVGLHRLDEILLFKSIEVSSPELHGAGVGSLNLAEGTVDLDVKVTTKGQKTIRKVPILGYVMAGEDEDPSINLTISGSLDNPKVEYGLVKEIVTIPYNMLYRTLRLPLHLYESLESAIH